MFFYDLLLFLTQNIKPERLTQRNSRQSSGSPLRGCFVTMFLGGNGANLIKLNQRRGADSVGRGGTHSRAGLPGELKKNFKCQQTHSK